MPGLGDRPNLGVLIQWVANAHLVEQGTDLLGQRLLDRALDDQTTATDATLPGVETDAKDDRVGCSIQVGIGEHHLRVLAAQFQTDLLHVARSRCHGQATDFGGPGEGHHIDVGMFADRLAKHRTRAGEHIEHSVRQAGVLHQPGQHQCGTGGQLAGLGHHGAAGSENERQTLGEDEEREVPGRDQADHADRLAGDQAEQAIAKVVEAVAVQCTGLPSGIFPDASGAQYFAPRLADWLAGLQGFAKRQGFAVLADQLSRAQ
ncbi:hypothetical protein D3C78_678760 [compost metagenome]